MRSMDSESRVPERSTTEIVQNLFGTVVGPCWADHSCSYQRHHGRLYLTSKAVCFYSNLFGFERRLCLFLVDVDQLELYRTTSIRISMVDGEDFVFKSLPDREDIFKTLSALKHNQTPTRLGMTQPEYSSSDITPRLGPLDIDRALQRSQSSPLPPLRRRILSAPDDVGVRTRKDSGGGHAQEHHVLNRSRIASSGDASSVSSENVQDRDEWLEFKQGKRPSSKETVVNAFKLSCSLRIFYDTLLADDAPWSIPRFQREIIGDSEIIVSSWVLDETGDKHVMHRTMTFQHPIKGKLGLGPSSAMTRREQRLRWFGSYGISLETSTFVKGIPAADCFYVNDTWLVEQHSAYISLTVQHRTRFTSGTMLKRLITQSAETEVKKWYSGYTERLTKIFKVENGNPKINCEKKDTEDQPTKKEFSFLDTTKELHVPTQKVFMSIIAYILFLGMAMFLQQRHFQQQLLLLHQDVFHLRKEQEKLSYQLS